MMLSLFCFDRKVKSTADAVCNNGEESNYVNAGHFSLVAVIIIVVLLYVNLVEIVQHAFYFYHNYR